ncbi:MAG TPA: PQQ-dependent sugar dehydrogenase [Terriglobales bacterium]|nr:PQQ-dependent sugar dehydrogenase [Terriglobales bacterium]
MTNAILALAILLACHATTATAQLIVHAERIAAGLDAPVFVTAPPGDMNRLFIVEQNNARILILHRDTGTLDATPFLSVPGVSTGGERGLLGLAFDPSYATNGFFYVNYTAQPDGRTVIARYTVSANPNVADSGSALQLLSFAQPQSNHNGGWIGFGPDGFLYIATGDGGAGNDSGTGHTEPGGNAQDLTENLLGKMLRIDVADDDFPADPLRNYAIPPLNPFVGEAGDDEIWAFGLRNPWRASFDRLTGDLWIGDVGQGVIEEVDFQPAASGGGENYGWRLREGTIATPGGVGGPRPSGAIDPVYEYSHGGGALQGSTVTGGYVYRGPIAALQGRYLFADFSNSRVWTLRFDGSSPAEFDGGNYTDFVDLTDAIVTDLGSIDLISSFGEDPAGNLFVVDYGGEVFEVTAAVDALGEGDPFKLFKTKTTKGAAKLMPFGPVELSDSFGSAEYDVTKTLQLGVPVELNGDSAGDVATHLVEYKLSSRRSALAVERQVVNSCNSVSIELGKPVSLLVPASFDFSSSPAAPDAASHEVDHFVCYKARALAKLPRGTQVELADDFDAGATRRYDLRRITKYCLPAAKNGAPVFLKGDTEGTPKTITPATVENSDRRLLCYQAKLARNFIVQSGCGAAIAGDRGSKIDPAQLRHSRITAADSNDQFGPQQLDTVKEMELCLPTMELP